MILIILKRIGNMPYLATILKGFLIFCFMLSTSIFFFLKVNYVKHLRFGLETILIQRTQFGIPYVKAPSLCSAVYGWGYATAEDRLFQLAFKRLIGKGRLSKYLGKKALNVDKIFRQLNFDYWAKRTAQRMKRQNLVQYNCYESYVKGVNDHVKFLNFLPIQFHLIGLQWEPMTVSDMFLYIKLLKWSQSFNAGEQFIRSQLLQNYTQQEVLDMVATGKKWESFNLIPIVSDEQIKQRVFDWKDLGEVPELNPQKIEQLFQVGMMQYLDSERGSNSWVIHGNHTESGLPLIANDPHLQSAIPHEWHQIRIEYIHDGRTVFWQGASMTGIPIIVGKTSYFSFAMTVILADSQDLYKEQVRDDSYLVDGELIKLKKRVQLIQVKGEQTIQHMVQQTHRGPIVSFVSYWGTIYEINPIQKISLIWSGFHDNYANYVLFTHSAQVNSIQRLRDMFEHNTKDFPNMNALYSTIDNHIGYVALGSLPIRRNHMSGLFVKDGSKSQNDWCGLIQKQNQLSLQDPAKGYIVTANNKPISEKYFDGVYEVSIMTARANRIDELIRQKIQKGEKLNMQDMKRIQLDTVDILCRQNVPYILQGVSQASEYLQNFNCDFTKQSYAATVYEVFFYQLFKLIRPLSSQNINLLSSLGFQSYLFRYIRNYTQENVKNHMKKAFENTIQNLTAFFNTKSKEQWHWEKYHADIIIHRPFSGSEVLKPFYEKKFGGRGNINTVNVGKMNKQSQGDFSVTNRANIRMIWSHAVNESSYWIGDTGISEKFYSRHYDDQLKLFARDEYLQVNFTKEEQIMRTSGQL